MPKLSNTVISSLLVPHSQTIMCRNARQCGVIRATNRSAQLTECVQTPARFEVKFRPLGVASCWSNDSQLCYVLVLCWEEMSRGLWCCVWCVVCYVWCVVLLLLCCWFVRCLQDCWSFYLLLYRSQSFSKFYCRQRQFTTATCKQQSNICTIVPTFAIRYQNTKLSVGVITKTSSIICGVAILWVVVFLFSHNTKTQTNIIMSQIRSIHPSMSMSIPWTTEQKRMMNWWTDDTLTALTPSLAHTHTHARTHSCTINE